MITFFIGIYQNIKRKNVFSQVDAIPESFILSAIVWVLWIYSWIHVLSFFNAICFHTIALLFVIPNIAFVIQMFRDRKIEFLVDSRKVIDNYSKSIIGVLCLVIIGCMLILGCFATPYNWDSMQYHMPRVAHWAQNGSIFYYGTREPRQLSSTVLASYIVTFIYTLIGEHDYLIALVQCVPYAINAFMVFLICRRVGISKKYSRWGTLMYLLMPIAFFESQTLQNDELAAMWLLFFVYLLLPLLQNYKKHSYDYKWTRILSMIMCVVFGYLTKPAVCFACLIFLVWYLIVLIKEQIKVHEICSQGVIGIVILAIMSAPQCIMNYSTFGSISVQQVGARQLIGTLKPHYVLVNFVKNMCQNLNGWITSKTRTDIVLQGLTYRLAEFLKVNINDPAIAEDGKIFEVYPHAVYNCEMPNNTLIVVLTLICIVVTIACWKRIPAFQRKFIIAVDISFIAFCNVLRWEPFVTRYMIGYLALLIPGIMIVGEYVCAQPKYRWLKWIVMSFVLVAMARDVYGEIRATARTNIYCRPMSYYAYQPQSMNNYEEIGNAIIANGQKDVAFYCGGNWLEYAMWAKLKTKGCHIEHVLVDGNDSKKLEDMNYIPEYIITTTEYYSDGELMCHNEKYEKIVANDELSLYYKEQEE